MSYDLFARFSESVQRHPNDIACPPYTYSRLYELSLKAAAFLTKEGINQQERVAILLENSAWWPAIYFGIMAIGATAVPIDPKLTPGEINNLLRDSQAKILFSSPELFLPLKDSLKNNPDLKKTLLYPFSELEAIEAAREINNADKGEFIASLLYTSGTTASPKGVMLTHKNFCSNSESISRLNLIREKDNIVSILPLHHSYPFMITLVVPLLVGARVTFLNSLKSEDLLKCLQETQGTILVGVPQLYQLLHKGIMARIKNPKALFSILRLVNFTHGFGLNLNKILLAKLHRKFGKSLRFFFCGGARLEPKVNQELTLLGFDLLEGYGLTETSPVVTFNPPGRVKFGSAGIPLPQVKIKIHNPDAEGIGEVLIQGPNVMKGYYKKPQETQEAIKEGWFYSGDLGYLDKEGYLFLTGRSKEVIVLSSGKNIYPEEIEAHYLKTPYIKDICVLEKTSAEGTASLYAIILPNFDHFRLNKETNIRGKLREEMESLSQSLPAYKRIMGWGLTKEELSRTRLGKLKRYEIKAEYLTTHAGPDLQTVKTEGPADKTEGQILEFLSRELKRKVSPSEHLELDLGVDSLTRVELIIGLEKMFQLNLSDADLSDVFTVKELIDKIRGFIGQNKKP